MTAAIAARRSVPATTSTGRSAGPRTSAPGASASRRDRAPGSQIRPEPVAATWLASSSAAAGPAAASAWAVKSFVSGPPSAILTSGRFESSSAEPYLGPSGTEQVAVTPCLASATMRSRTACLTPIPAPAPASRGAKPSVAGSAGAITSATPIACERRSPARPVSVTRAVDPMPNHSCAGLSSV